MTGVPLAPLAARAGVEPAWVGRLADLGILRPAEDGSFSAGDVRRARLLDDLERAGVWHTHGSDSHAGSASNVDRTCAYVRNPRHVSSAAGTGLLWPEA